MKERKKSLGATRTQAVGMSKKAEIEELAADLKSAGDRYAAELARREAFLPKLSLVATQLAVIGAGVTIAARDFTYGWDPATALFALALVAAAGTIGCALCFTGRAWHGHVYKAMPLLAQYRTYRVELAEWGTAQSMAKEDVLLTRLRRDVLDMEARHDDTAATNDKRGEFTFQANRWLIWSVCAAAIVGAVYVSDAAAERHCTKEGCVNWVESAFSVEKAPRPACPPMPPKEKSQ